ncbi:uncharacterized protein LOC110020082 [Phalaenopsis equestris]|uniref:uncharacterized protein LOC110020082 n=1 Tax=Phalaenopsis equestris TaxID=78828 RepID=UPI0009E25960|nr:uncharacterized protein LOC110020082 [Phalaenopsis equestris]
MAKSILGCFLFSSCYDQINSSRISSKDLDAFYYSYSEDLSQLSKSFSIGSISLNCSIEAMKILKKIQVELLILIKKSNLLICSGTEEGDWFSQYMKDSITMLDFCNSLKLAVSRIDRYRILVDIMINKLNKNYSSKIIEFESKKYSNFNTVEETIKQCEGISVEDESNNSIMVVVSVLLHSTIVSKVSIELGGCDLASRCPQLKPFIEMLSMLVREFNERDFVIKNGSGSELVEHDIVRRMMVDIQTQVMDGIEDKERYLSSLKLLRTSLIELKEGIEKLDDAVDDVFDVVIKGRNEMMGVLRNRDFVNIE